MLAQSVMPVPVRAVRSRPAGSVDLGVLAGEITPDLVDEVIDLSGCREKRQRLLPARTVVYFVLGLCLFSGADSCGPPGYRSVMRWLTNGLRHLHGLPLPTSPALPIARAVSSQLCPLSRALATISGRNRSAWSMRRQVRRLSRRSPRT